MMADITLRGRVDEEGRIELIDPLPVNFDRTQPVKVILEDLGGVYESTNEYGDRVLVDELNGIVTPVNPLTPEEFLASPIIGLWKDRRQEFGNSADWVRKQRDETEDDPWQGRRLS